MIAPTYVSVGDELLEITASDWRRMPNLVGTPKRASVSMNCRRCTEVADASDVAANDVPPRAVLVEWSSED